MEKKYEFTGKKMNFEGHVLREIFYVGDVSYAYEGEVGGWIESEDNLSHEGNCMVLDEAKVFGNARVMGEAVIGKYAIVKDNAQIKDEAVVYGESIVGADTIVSGFAKIEGKSSIYFYANPFETDEKEAHISGCSIIEDCNIEATGQIIDSNLTNIVLDGNVNLVDKNNDTEDTEDTEDTNDLITFETMRDKLANVNYGNEMTFFDINSIFKR